MSLYLAGGVAFAYAAGVVTVHRVAVARRKAQAQGYSTIRWLDWDTLLHGVLPPAEATLDRSLPEVPEGGPAPRLLLRPPSKEVQLLEALVAGEPVQAEAFAEAGFSGGEAKWLGLLSWLRDEPRRVLEQLEATAPATVAEAYLREWLALEHEVSPLNLELASFASKLRVNRALRRFGEHAALYFVRARASSLLGFTQAVVDDLARAVYFSRQAPFYLEAVNRMPFIEEARPALARACRAAVGDDE
ncbi:MAG: hypothetical protein ACOZQL_36055 [Myxococcota bacterium]